MPRSRLSWKSTCLILTGGFLISVSKQKPDPTGKMLNVTAAFQCFDTKTDMNLLKMRPDLQTESNGPIKFSVCLRK